MAKKYEVYLVAPNTESRIVDGVHVVGVPMPRINERLKRMFNLHSLLKPLYEIDAEVYHFHDPELISLGLKLKKKGKKIVFDSHEDVPMQFLNKGFIPKPLRKTASKIYAWHEARVLKHYSAVVTVTVHIVDRLKRINPNTYQITNYPVLQNRPIIKRVWDRTVCFAGLMSPHWELDKIIEVLPQVGAKMKMAGLYATEDYLKELKSLDGWNFVDFQGTLTHDKVIELYKNSSIGLAIESYNDPNVGFRVGSLGVTKIPDYMASGLPIIVSDSLVWGDIVRKHQCGVVVSNPEDKEEIARGILSILDNPKEAQRMSDNALKATQEVFNWGTQELVLFEMYKNILGE